MKNAFFIFLISTLFCACQSEKSDTAYFITKLGKDTLAIERFTSADNLIIADVVLRSPRTTLRSYALSWDEDRAIETMTVTDFTNNRAFNAEGSVVQKIKSQGDSLELIYTTQNGDRLLMVENRDGLIPFVDMVHWPYEIAFNRATTIANDSIDQFMITGRRNANFIIHRVDDTSYTLRHPSRGVMEVTTTYDGELMSLDAKATTRKVIVERAFDLDFDKLATSFAEKDQSGSPFGSLSPAVVNEYYFKGNDFKVSYGSPSKRGRELFGGIVAYGQRWRTGANRATHFEITKDIIIEEQTLPAGEYTLFTIPEEDGGVLIINKQTGQNGRSYDESQDFMRVPLSRSNFNPEIESFTITVDETETGGRLNLAWGRTIYYIDFVMIP